MKEFNLVLSNFMLPRGLLYEGMKEVRCSRGNCQCISHNPVHYQVRLQAEYMGSTDDSHFFIRQGEVNYLVYQNRPVGSGYIKRMTP